MKQAILIVVVLTSVFGCSKDTFVGSGETISEFRQVSSFNKLSSEGVFNVTITKGNEQSVEIIADNNIMNRVRTEVVNGRLKLHLADGNYNNVHLEAHITVLNLNDIQNEGSGNIHVFNNYNAGDFRTINKGSGHVVLEGSCTTLDIRNEGSGDIFGQDMATTNATIKNIGSGAIEVRCESQLSVIIEGSGSVYYKGTPFINATISGSGRVINDN